MSVQYVSVQDAHSIGGPCSYPLSAVTANSTCRSSSPSLNHVVTLRSSPTPIESSSKVQVLTVKPTALYCKKISPVVQTSATSVETSDGKTLKDLPRNSNPASSETELCSENTEPRQRDVDSCTLASTENVNDDNSSITGSLSSEDLDKIEESEMNEKMSSEDMDKIQESGMNEKLSSQDLDNIQESEMNGSSEDLGNIQESEMNEKVSSEDLGNIQESEMNEKVSSEDLDDIQESEMIEKAPPIIIKAISSENEISKASVNITTSEAKNSETDASMSSALHSTDEDITVEYSSPAEETDCDNKKSKVVVLAMPSFDFGHITALEQCISDDPRGQHNSKTRKNDEFVDENEENQGKSDECSKDIGMKKRHLQEDTSHVVNTKRFKRDKRFKTHRLFFHIKPGKGSKLSEIGHIASKVSKASPNFLRILHYILYDLYGSIYKESTISQTRENILHFSGFPFHDDVEWLERKKTCLFRLPLPLLSKVCSVLLNWDFNRDRTLCVLYLLKFLVEPSDSVEFPLSEHLETMDTYTDCPPEELALLKENALKGPTPVVVVEKLQDGLVEKLKERQVRLVKPYFSEISSHPAPTNDDTGYIARQYINSQSAIKLKSIPEVADKIRKARRRLINVLHILLYGKPGSDDANRQNILEYGGIKNLSSARKNFCIRGQSFLQKLKNKEIVEICQIFNVRAKICQKTKKIKKLLQYLYAPTRRKIQAVVKAVPSKPPAKFLSEFDIIRSRVECAPPEDLIPLNDLLNLKRGDISDIHQSVLNFSPLQCNEDSSAFQARQIVLQYMNFEVIKQIAHFLDIPSWEEYSHSSELASSILFFLTRFKHQQPTKVLRSSKSPLVNRSRPLILKVGNCDNNENSSFAYENHNHESHALSDNAQQNMQYPNEYHCVNNKENGQNSNIVIHRISESSYSYTDVQNDECFTVSDSKSEEALSVCDLINHPSEKELEATIRAIVSSNSFKLSLGDLIRRVYDSYQDMNISYRIDFIKAKAVEIVKEYHENMTHSEKNEEISLYVQ